MHVRLVVAALLVLVLASSVVAAPPPQIPKDIPKQPKSVKLLSQGALFCPRYALVFGAIVIRAGRCYTVLIVRDSRGTFLAFGPPKLIPPGQLVRMGTPAGAKLRGRLFYLVPVRTRAALIPLGTMRLVAVQLRDFGPQMIFVLQGLSAPVQIVFVVRL